MILLNLLVMGVSARCTFGTTTRARVQHHHWQAGEKESLEVLGDRLLGLAYRPSNSPSLDPDHPCPHRAMQLHHLTAVADAIGVATTLTVSGFGITAFMLGATAISMKERWWNDRSPVQQDS